MAREFGASQATGALVNRAPTGLAPAGFDRLAGSAIAASEGK